MPSYYCEPADIRANVAGTDSGSGTCAQMNDPFLQDAIGRASSRVSAYTGEDYDPSEVPDLVAGLTVQLATYYATLTYRKSMDLSATDPIALGYADAMATLRAISTGQVQVSPAQPQEPPVAPQPSVPRVVNTIPAVFSGSDSATEVTPWGNLRARGAYGSGWGDRGGW